MNKKAGLLINLEERLSVLKTQAVIQTMARKQISRALSFYLCYMSNVIYPILGHFHPTYSFWDTMLKLTAQLCLVIIMQGLSTKSTLVR